MECIIQHLQIVLQIVLSFLIEAEPQCRLPAADGIFVFGHVDPRLAHHAAKLWYKRRALRVVLTGKGKKRIPFGFGSEASYYTAILKSDGIPTECLILEEKSTNSLENVLFGVKACRDRGWEPQTLILCAMPPLLRRSCATFRRQFPQILVHGSTFATSMDEWLNPWLIRRILAEFDRFEQYAESGYIAPVVVPQDVQQAVKELKVRLML